MSNDTKMSTGLGGLQGAIPINRQQLAAVGQATVVDPLEVPANTTPANQQAQAPAPMFPEPSWSDILIDASLSTLKAAAGGAVVGAALSQSGRRSRSIVRGATVSATVSPLVMGMVDVARIQIRETTPEQKAAERRWVLKTSGVAMLLGAAALGIDYALTKTG